MSMTDQGIGPAANPGYRAYVLALLMVVYTFNFLDRQILAILAPYIQAEMGFDDEMMGLLAVRPSPSSIRPWPCPSPGWPTG